MVAKLSRMVALVACVQVATGSGLLARTWTEAGTGRKIEADLVTADAAAVVLATRNGRRFTLPLERLSAEDRAFLLKSKSPEAAGADTKSARAI